MSQFTSFISVRIPHKGCDRFQLLDDLIYERWWEWSGDKVIVPRGFLTDFASFPRILRSFFNPYDPRWILPAILHDYLWSIATTLKEYQTANDIFHEAMEVCKTPPFLQNVMYLTVSATKYFYYLLKKCSIQ